MKYKEQFSRFYMSTKEYFKDFWLKGEKKDNGEVIQLDIREAIS